MADISFIIGVDDKDVITSIKNMKKLETDAKKVFASLKKGTQTYANGLSEVRKALVKTGLTTKQAYDQVRKLEKAYANTVAQEKSVKAEKKRAAALKETIAAERKAQVETKKLAAEVDRLSSKYKPLYASSKQYEKSLDEINRAHKVGAINTQQHSAAVENLNSDYQKFTNGTAGWENQFVQGSNRAGKSANRFGMYAQQVGYQVGDFFVQVQSGQSALVAFGQQGTQLAGLLPGVTGAVVGIGLAVGTMLLRSFMDASGEAQTLEEAITGATDALDAYKDSVAGGESLKDDFGSMSSSMVKIADESARFAENMLRANIGQAVSMQSIESTGIGGYFEKFLDRWIDTTGAVYSGSGSGPLGGLTGNDLSEGKNLADLGLSPELTIGNLKEYQESVANALAGREYKTAVDLMGGIYKKALSGMSDEAQMAMGTQGKEFVNSIKDQMEALAKFVKAQEDAANAPQKARSKIFNTYASSFNDLRNEGLLSQTRQDFGEGSDTYKETLKQQTIAAYRDEQALLVKSKDLSQALADVLVVRFIALQDILQAEETKKANDKAALEAAKEQKKLDEAATVAFLARGKAASQRVADTIKQLEVDRKIAAKEAETAKQLAYTVNLGKEKARLSEIELAGNKESTEYRNQEILLASMASVEASRRLGYSEETTATMEAQAVAQVTVTNQIADAATEAALLAKGLQEAEAAMNSLSSFGAGLDKALAIAVAKTEALKAGSTGSIAGNIAGRRADLDAKSKNARVMGADPALIEAAHKAQTTTINLLETELKLIEALEGKNKTGKGDKETGSAAIKKLILEAEHREKIAGLTSEQARYEDLLFKTQESNATKREPLLDAELRIAVDLIHATNERIRVIELQKKAQEDLANTISSSMETAMMDMVSGTKSVKDAFREMALDIVKHLYKVLVVQQMIQSIGGMIPGPIGKAMSTYGQADGGAWSGGSQIQAYANGGVVNSPTLFGMSGSKTGLMGEAGPEAIMPLKRGSNGKLGVQMEGGGNQSTVVNQTFNFSANGDESVKRIISESAPAIAEMTQAKIINSRRRGGQMRQVFR